MLPSLSAGVDSAAPVLHKVSGNNQEELAKTSCFQQRSCLNVSYPEGDKKLQPFVLVCSLGPAFDYFQGGKW